MIRDATDRGVTQQLFVAHSGALCENARRIFLREGGAGTCTEGVSFVTLQRLIPQIEAHFGGRQEWPSRSRVDYFQFKHCLWPAIEQALASSSAFAGWGSSSGNSVSIFLKWCFMCAYEKVRLGHDLLSFVQQTGLYSATHR